MIFPSHLFMIVIIHYLSPRLRCICSWWWKQTDIRFDSSFVPVTHLLPCGAVTVTPFISPAVLFVLPISYFFMLLAVQTVCQFRTAGVITRFLWLSWHDIHLLIFGHIKSRRPVFVTAPRLGSYLLFHATIITHSLLYYTIFYCQVFFFGIERAAEQII